MMSDSGKWLVYTDGGSRGNPGPSAIGVVIYDEKGVELWAVGKYIGEGTNNEAEYSAIESALEWLRKNAAKWQKEGVKIGFRLDSKLVVEQLLGNWKIKEPRMRVLWERCRKIMAELEVGRDIKHIPREENKRADELVNEALDKELS